MQPASVVYVVDDDPLARDVLARVLTGAGLTVEAFADGPSFLESFDRGRPGCVLLDVRMPGMSGLEVLAELRARRVTTPVIILTGYADVATAVQAFKAGASEFVEKPFNRERVLQLVSEALERDRRAFRERRQQTETRLRLAQLTARERQVLDLVVAGFTTKAIAEKLGLRSKTVQVYRARINEKMGARNVADLVRLIQARDKQ